MSTLRALVPCLVLAAGCAGPAESTRQKEPATELPPLRATPMPARNVPDRDTFHTMFVDAPCALGVTKGEGVQDAELAAFQESLKQELFNESSPFHLVEDEAHVAISFQLELVEEPHTTPHRADVTHRLRGEAMARVDTSAKMGARRYNTSSSHVQLSTQAKLASWRLEHARALGRLAARDTLIFLAEQRDGTPMVHKGRPGSGGKEVWILLSKVDSYARKALVRTLYELKQEPIVTDVNPHTGTTGRYLKLVTKTDPATIFDELKRLMKEEEDIELEIERQDDGVHIIRATGG